MSKKTDEKTTPTFLIPCQMLDRAVSREKVEAMAWRISSEIAEVHEVHIEDLSNNSHALVVLIKLPEALQAHGSAGRRASTAAISNLTTAVHSAAEAIVRNVAAGSRERVRTRAGSR